MESPNPPQGSPLNAADLEREDIAQYFDYHMETQKPFYSNTERELSSTSLKGLKEKTWSFPAVENMLKQRPFASKIKLLLRRVSRTSSWCLEYFGLLNSVGAIAGIIAILAHFNGRASPDWPHGITLNALIALLATIATANIAIPLQNSISQLKWIRFKVGPAPLSDIEVFDEASRGMFGAVKLLISARGGFLGSLGAFIAIISLAIGPFTQQVVTYRLRTVEIPAVASIPRALNYTGALPGNSSSTGFVPLLPLKAAVYNGLFAENNRPIANLQVTCGTGNCTWASYDSLAVCPKCEDISASMTRYCDPDTPSQNQGNVSSCGWRVPQGAILNGSSDVFSMTSLFPSPYGGMPHSTIMQLLFLGTESQNGTPGEVTPWALKCTLEACIQTISSVVINGAINETVTRTMVDTSRSANSSYNVYLTDTSNRVYQVTMEAMLAMHGWFPVLFQNGSATRTSSNFNRTINDNSVVVNLTVGISSGETFFDTDIVTAFYWNFYKYPAGLEMLMSDLATSMTVAFRSFSGAEKVLGTEQSVESYVHVRWEFIALPVAVVALTAIFLATTISRNRKANSKLWKSSALAVLFHGLDPEVRRALNETENFYEKKRKAKDLCVRLDELEGCETLLRG